MWQCERRTPYSSNSQIGRKINVSNIKRPQGLWGAPVANDDDNYFGMYNPAEENNEFKTLGL